uniref:ATP synthase F0 subunit 8 n=1 Tax=Margattea spinifera TaxID=1928775 RepID=UPI0027A14B92|nr:ATP synthase F0 subunit 8 [Margattea spinifera]WGO57850.1 ATP synthase F0 subunit 8 [Margattea spinifera]
MPQMMPLNWLFLFIIFTLTLLLFNIMNYFQPVPAPLSTSLHIKSIMYTWKW